MSSLFACFSHFFAAAFAVSFDSRFLFPSPIWLRNLCTSFDAFTTSVSWTMAILLSTASIFCSIERTLSKTLMYLLTSWFACSIFSSENRPNVPNLRSLRYACWKRT